MRRIKGGWNNKKIIIKRSNKISKPQEWIPYPVIETAYDIVELHVSTMLDDYEKELISCGPFPISMDEYILNENLRKLCNQLKEYITSYKDDINDSYHSKIKVALKRDSVFLEKYRQVPESLSRSLAKMMLNMRYGL